MLKFFALSLLAGVSGAVAGEHRSIVGRWSAGTPCSQPVADLTVSPMGLMLGDELICDFDNVRRDGDVVAWRGACAMGDEGRHPSTVVATLAHERLAVVINGGANGPYRRCGS